MSVNGLKEDGEETDVKRVSIYSSYQEQLENQSSHTTSEGMVLQKKSNESSSYTSGDNDEYTSGESSEYEGEEGEEEIEDQCEKAEPVK